MSKHDHLYSGRPWRRLRAMHLTEHPLCEFCQQLGRVTAADTVDHRRPHHGNVELFYDPENLCSLCGSCHSMHKQRMERGDGLLPGCGLDGVPLDPLHPWNKR